MRFLLMHVLPGGLGPMPATVRNHSATVPHPHRSVSPHRIHSGQHLRSANTARTSVSSCYRCHVLVLVLVLVLTAAVSCWRSRNQELLRGQDSAGATQLQAEEHKDTLAVLTNLGICLARASAARDSIACPLPAAL